MNANTPGRLECTQSLQNIGMCLWDDLDAGCQDNHQQYCNRNNDNNLGASYISTTTVTVIVSGSEANIENITASDCVAYIDLKDSNGNLLEPGDYDLNVYIEKNTNAYVSFSCDPNHIKITLIGQE